VAGPFTAIEDQHAVVIAVWPQPGKTLGVCSAPDRWAEDAAHTGKAKMWSITSRQFFACFPGYPASRLIAQAALAI
jgi:hypothetical protein